MRLTARRPVLMGVLVFLVLTVLIAEGVWWAYGYETPPREVLDAVMQKIALGGERWFGR